MAIPLLSDEMRPKGSVAIQDREYGVGGCRGNLMPKPALTVFAISKVVAAARAPI